MDKNVKKNWQVSIFGGGGKRTAPIWPTQRVDIFPVQSTSF